MDLIDFCFWKRGEERELIYLFSLLLVLVFAGLLSIFGFRSLARSLYFSYVLLA